MIGFTDPAGVFTGAWQAAVFGISHDAVDGLPDGCTTMRLDHPPPIGGVGPQWGAPAPHWDVYFGVQDVDVAAPPCGPAAAEPSPPGPGPVTPPG